MSKFIATSTEFILNCDLARESFNFLRIYNKWPNKIQHQVIQSDLFIPQLEVT